jgi:hypothetical protein
MQSGPACLSRSNATVDSLPQIQEVYRRNEKLGGLGGGRSKDLGADTHTVVAVEGCGPTQNSGNEVWRAAPAIRELPQQTGERTSATTLTDEDFDAHRASTYGVEDWRTKECGTTGARSADICKEKARPRRETKSSRPCEGTELIFEESSTFDTCKASLDVGGYSTVGAELYDSRVQRRGSRDDTGCGLGDECRAVEL